MKMMQNHKTISSSSSSSFNHSVIHRLLFWLMMSAVTLTTSTSLDYSNETDRLSLLDIKRHVIVSNNDVLNSWNESEHHCRWPGVSCGRRHQRVVAVSLPAMGLAGTLSPQIGNLTFLRYIDMSNNSLHGEIPGAIGSLFRLRHLNLSANALTGNLTKVNLSNCSELRELDISKNALRGELPTNLSNSAKLEILYLFRNQFTGSIPHSFGNLSSLRVLSLVGNHLEGALPHEITQCRSLVFLSLGLNNLSGTLSPAFFNMTSLSTFSVLNNSLQGTVPSYIGHTMPNLRLLILSGNRFGGAIPSSISNITNLGYVHFSDNYFVGKVPENIGRLKALRYLNLGRNLLGNDLAFISSLSNCSELETFSIYNNRFEGRLPNTIGNLSSNTLSFLNLGGNRLFGTVPKEIKNLANLFALVLDENLLSGVIPSEIGELYKLQGLSMQSNRFTGEIPGTLFNLTSLTYFSLDGNELYGGIPSNVSNFRYLIELTLSNNNFNGTIPDQVFDLPSLSKFLVLSGNSFTGPLSPAVGTLRTLNGLDVSRNMLSGKITGSLGGCVSLEALDMHANRFHGNIPNSLASLKNLKYLDLSGNNLSGEILRELRNLPYLQYLNLSFNDLEGEVPTGGVFAKAGNVYLFGNRGLCGGMPELNLPPCPTKTRRKHRKHLLMIILFSCAGVAVMLIAFAFVISQWAKKRKRESFEELSKIEKLSKVSYSHLHRATNGFSEANLIGSGSFGSVYRGKFETKTFAVKVLDLLKHGASKSFIAECKALRNIRHRNLVPILTCCSSCDLEGNEFKALVYKFMENGDLDTWLHPTRSDPRTRPLSVLQRLNIAIDVASALHYLHDDCDPPVVHCDIKPSNILLDGDLTAHVGDFGLSRLHSKILIGSSREQSSTIGLKGTVGYIPPEYGMGAEATTFGDSYSYGIFLMELFTAKRPTDDVFTSGNICEYVETSLPEQVMKIVDPMLLLEVQERNHGNLDNNNHNKNHLVEIIEVESNNKMNDLFISVFKVGLSCASTSPMDRTSTKDVHRELNKIKKTYFL